MFDVENEEAVVEAFLGRDADAGPAGGVLGLVVNAHVYRRVGAGAFDGDETAFGGGLEVFVLDEAVGGIFSIEEDEGVEPVAGGVAVCETVSRQRCVDERGAGKDREEMRGAKPAHNSWYVCRVRCLCYWMYFFGNY